MPEPATQALHQQIPRPVLLQILQHKARKKKSGLPASVRLPNFPFALLGREQEIHELNHALANFRLVTIVGIGGVGKTRLAVQVAQEMTAEGKLEAAFLDLTACSHSDLLQTVAAALGIRESVSIPLSRSVSDFLGVKTLLLVLDNCEHLIEAAAMFCAGLLRDCPHLSLLATSRETLRVDGEQAVTLAPLALPSSDCPEWEACRAISAVRLFAERATAACPQFQLTVQNAALVVQLCRLADGLPLGIEIIASQAGSISLERIAADLAECLLRLKHRKRGIVPRHQNLLAALDWSYSILNGPEQILMRRLAVFSGGWTLDAAEQVCSDGTLPRSEVSCLLSDLASKSLVFTIASDHEALRYQFLETVRNYADEHLSAASEQKQLQQRYLDYFVSLAEEAERQISGENQKEWLTKLDAEAMNLRGCLQISVENAADYIDFGLRLAYGLQRYWEARGTIGEGREWCSALLAKTEATHKSAARARVLDLAGWYANICSDYETASATLQASLGLFRQQGNQKDASLTLIRLGLVKVNQGDYQGAKAVFEESLAIRRELKDKRLIAMALLNLGIAVSNLSDYPLARAHYEECQSLLKQAGDQRSLAACLGNLAHLAMTRDEYPLACSLYEESMALSQRLGDKYMMRFTHHSIGNLAARMGNLGKASSAYAQCLQLSLEAQVPYHIIGSLEGLSNALLQQEEWERGVQLWGATEVLRRTCHFDADTWERQRHDALMPTVIARFGAEACKKALNIGYSLSQEASVALALGIPL